MSRQTITPILTTTAFTIGVLLLGVLLQSAFATNSTDNESRSLSAKQRSEIDNHLNQMSLRDKVASLFILHASGTDSMQLKSFVDTYDPAGIIMMGDNIPDSDTELRSITNSLQEGKTEFPLLITIDQEGGSVSRLPSDTHPAGAALMHQPVDKTTKAFANRSDLVESIGANLNFGIVADVTDDPNSYIYPRVLGATPRSSSERVASAVRATENKTLSTIKHFPGHGETNADSHLSIPTTDIDYATWQQRAKPPFQAGIHAGADMVMFSHLRYIKIDDAPASLSKKWHDILQDELRFTGISITDDMFMLQNSGDPLYSDPVRNAISALLAGNSLLLFVTQNGPNTDVDPNLLIDGVVAAVEDGTISSETIDQNTRNILQLRHNLAR